MMGSESETLDLTIPSSMDYLSLVNGVVEDICGRIGADETAGDLLTTSVIEACTNAIEHGNGEDPGKLVTLHFLFDRTKIEVFVTDEGEGFDPDAVADPVQPENLLRERGRGIFILRSFMDEVDFRFTPSRGTTVHLVKNLGGTRRAAG